MLSDLTIKEYLEKTAGKNTVPAGGGASALSAALAASLTEKIANLIASKQENEYAKAEMEEISERMNALREEFTQCIDRDVEAYQELAKAYKMPEETEDDKKDRDEQIQKSILIAAMDNIQKSIEQVGSNKESVKQAEKGCVIAKKRYEVGKGTVLELNDSELALTQSKLAYTQAIFDYLSAKADLELVLGKDKVVNTTQKNEELNK